MCRKGKTCFGMKEKSRWQIWLLQRMWVCEQLVCVGGWVWDRCTDTELSSIHLVRSHAPYDWSIEKQKAGLAGEWHTKMLHSKHGRNGRYTDKLSSWTILGSPWLTIEDKLFTSLSHSITYSMFCVSLFQLFTEVVWWAVFFQGGGSIEGDRGRRSLCVCVWFPGFNRTVWFCPWCPSLFLRTVFFCVGLPCSGSHLWRSAALSDSTVVLLQRMNKVKLYCSLWWGWIMLCSVCSVPPLLLLLCYTYETFL